GGVARVPRRTGDRRAAVRAGEAGRVRGRGARAAAETPRGAGGRDGHLDRRPRAVRGPGLEVHRRRQQHGPGRRRRQSAQRRALRALRGGRTPLTGRVMTATIVLKFGSSVLPSEEALPRAVAEIARHRDLGRSVVAVVSAIGTTTDVLLEKAHRISRSPEPSALALMVAPGEDVAEAFLTLAIESAG